MPTPKDLPSSLQQHGQCDRSVFYTRTSHHLSGHTNALAETVNGYYKAELVRGPARSGPWKIVEDVELATLGWVHWHNTARLHGYLGDVPPTEYEQAFYAAHRADHDPVGIPS